MREGQRHEAVKEPPAISYCCEKAAPAHAGAAFGFLCAFCYCVLDPDEVPVPVFVDDVVADEGDEVLPEAEVDELDVVLPVPDEVVDEVVPVPVEVPVPDVLLPVPDVLSEDVVPLSVDVESAVEVESAEEDVSVDADESEEVAAFSVSAFTPVPCPTLSESTLR